MTSSALKQASEDEEPVVDVGGLLRLNAYQLRILTENPFSGGAGYNYRELGQMTLDQVHHRLCDMDILKDPVGQRTKSFDGKAALGVVKPDEDGYIKGRDAKGNPIKAKIGGKSLARRLMEEEQARKEATASDRKRRRSKKR